MTAEELKAIRAKQGLSQRAFAEVLGLSNVEIARWETGKRPIPRWLVLLLRNLEGVK